MNGNDEQDAKGCFYDGYEVKCFFWQMFNSPNFQEFNTLLLLEERKTLKIPKHAFF